MVFWRKFILYALLVEVLMILLFLVVIIFHRLFLIYKNKVNKNLEQEISKILINSLYGDQSQLPLLSKYKGQAILLSTLEKFSHRISDERWEKIKNEIVKDHLLSFARKKTFSRSWVKRNFAARCFALTPLEEDGKEILYLANDPIFLVSSVAAIAVLKLEKKEGVIQVLKKLSQSKGYARYFYEDLLSKASIQVYEWISDAAETIKDSSVHLACLELLSSKSIIHFPQFLKKDLNSEEVAMRFAATKIIARNPHRQNIALLLKSSKDHDPLIREEALMGLQYFGTEEVLYRLEIALQEEPVWFVRLQAAKTLKKLGADGMRILDRYANNPKLAGHEVALIALQEGGINA